MKPGDLVMLKDNEAALALQVLKIGDEYLAKEGGERLRLEGVLLYLQTDPSYDGELFAGFGVVLHRDQFYLVRNYDLVSV